MTSKFAIPLILFAISFAVFLFAVLLPWILKRKKDTEPTTPPNRRERRAQENKKEDFEHRRDIAEQAMVKRVGNLRYEVDQLNRDAAAERYSSFRYVKELLGLVESFFDVYEREATNSQVVQRYMPNVYHSLMNVICSDILTYANKEMNSSFQPFALELARFVERQFNLPDLDMVLSRNKGQVQYNDRCDALAAAILYYFTTPKTNSLSSGRLLPYDYLSTAELTLWSEVTSTFNKIAIEGFYVESLRNRERQDHQAVTRAQRDEHDNNRRQRARRIAKQGNRRRARR